MQREVGLHQILAGNVTHNYYMLGTAIKLSMPFKTVIGVVVTLESNIFLRLRSNCD